MCKIIYAKYAVLLLNLEKNIALIKKSPTHYLLLYLCMMKKKSVGTNILEIPSIRN